MLFFKRLTAFFLVLAFMTPSFAMMNGGGGGGASIFPIAPFYNTDVLFDISGVLKDPQNIHDLQLVGFKGEYLPAAGESVVPISSGVSAPYSDVKQAYARLNRAFEKAYYKNRAMMYYRALFQSGMGTLVLPLILGVAFGLDFIPGLDPNFFLGALLAYQILYFICIGIQGNMPLIMFRFWPSNDPYTKLELEYFKKKYMFLMLEHRDANRLFEGTSPPTTLIEDAFRSLRISFTQSSEISERIRSFLALPLKSRLVRRGADFAKYANLYIDEDRDILLRQIKAHKERFQAQLGLCEKPYRPFLALTSAPGTGKGYLIEGFSKTSGFPYAHVQLSVVKNQEDLLGSERRQGALLRAVLGLKGVRNGILFFDEFDKVPTDVIDALLPLIDPKKGSFRSEYLGIDVDLSHMFFVFAGNREIDHEALQDRFQPEHVARMRIDDPQKIVNALYKGSKADISSQLLERARESTWQYSDTNYYRFRGAQSLLTKLQQEGAV